MQLSAARVDLSKSSFLAIDDSAQSLDIMYQILTGFRVGKVRTSKSPDEARDLLSRSRFDLVLIDCEMPNEDGIYVTRHVRSNPDLPNFSTPIVLVSAHTPLDKVHRARDAGANLVVKKPVSPGILLSRIQWLGRSSRQFIISEGYSGPDRRIRKMPLPEGLAERRAQAIALTANADHAMSQDEVDSLFG